MLGSKNRELTRKYGCSALASTTLSLAISRLPVANSAMPMAAKTTASATLTASAAFRSRGVQATSTSSRNSSAKGT